MTNEQVLELLEVYPQMSKPPQVGDFVIIRRFDKSLLFDNVVVVGNKRFRVHKSHALYWAGGDLKKWNISQLTKQYILPIELTTWLAQNRP